MDTLTIFLLALAGTWLKVIQFFIALSILIVIHEFGHYLAARLTKTRVEKFYLFFDFMFPLPNVLNFSLFKKKIGETEYGMGWFPLGGYVSIAGMIDETKDTADMPEEPQPWEYRSKKTWQKLLIMLGGVIMNVLLALVIYTVAFTAYGEHYLPLNKAKYGFTASKLFKDIGFEDGDKVLKVGDKVPRSDREIFLTAFLNEAKTFTVDRNGKEIVIPIPEGTIGAVLKSKRFDMLQARIPAVVDSVFENGLNKDKLAIEDKLLSINGQSTPYIDVFHSEFTKAKANRALNTFVVNGGKKLPVLKPFSQSEISTWSNPALQDITVAVLRGADTIKFQPKLDSNKSIGFAFAADYDKFFDRQHDEYSFFQAIPRAFSFTGEKIRDYLIQLRLIFTSPEIEINESVGGFISIGKIFPGVFNMQSFLMLTAMISLILAVMNLIPIPGLDGGYVLFLLVEMITGRKVPDAVIEKANSVGLLILLALMLYVNGLDVFRLFQ